MPVPAEKTPLVTVELPPINNVPEFPDRVPFVRVRLPVNVLEPVPRSRVPPGPLMVRLPPLTIPLIEAVPAVFVIDTRPVVVK